VIGHEVAHIANGDMVTMTLIQGVMNTFVVFLSRVIGYAVDSALRKGDDREIAGMVSFWGIEHGDFDACTLSFLLDRTLEGRGLMRGLLDPVLPEVMTRYKLHRVMATHLPENLRSAALLRHLGFVVEGYARDFVKVNGHWRDNVLLSRIASE